MKHLNKTFRDISGKDWPKNEIPTDEDSNVVRKSYELYYKKIDEFTDEDLRFAIGQQWNLKYIIPLAIDILRDNPFAEGDFYPGSLLENVLKSDRNYWKGHPNERKAIEEIFLKNLKSLDKLEVTDEIKYDIKNAFEEFFNI